ncbi:hypothetical protein MMA231_01262 [Asticcacaulis sp. MM231]|uniref:glucoamylase family protein n=1 Tax=Asticcacaulis sp. MM231 TaxID=3157666 RepID=UPI0032D5A6C6
MTLYPHLSRRALLLGGATLGACLSAGMPSTPLARPRQHAQAHATDLGFNPVLTDLHRRTFHWFWDTANPANGMVPDATPGPAFASIAAIGFALTAYCIGVKSGYVTRQAAAARTLTTLRTLWNLPQSPEATGVSGHKGFFYHFLHMDSGLRYDRCELSTVDSAMLFLGALTSAAFFDGPAAEEAEIRKLGLALYERVDWHFVAHDNGLISMGWHPEPNLPDHDARGLIERDWSRYNEGMMVTLLALGSPTHPAGDWNAWMETIGGTWGPNFGEPHLGFSPMFGHQYSHVWFDFRGIADTFMRGKGIDYFINSRRATYAQRNYAIQNPGGFKDYGADVWGLTACRGPADVELTIGNRQVSFHEYGARGPQTGDNESFDDGTIAPTAGIASIAFAPDICIPLIQSLRKKYGSDLYGKYGFADAFNPTFPASYETPTGRHTRRAGWVAKDYLGIDQGPILCMLENHRSGFVWDLFNRSSVTGEIAKRAFRIAGFEAVAPNGQWLSA